MFFDIFITIDDTLGLDREIVGGVERRERTTRRAWRFILGDQ